MAHPPYIPRTRPRTSTRTAVVAVVVALAVAAWPGIAAAHTPVQDGRAHPDAEHALVLADPGLSQVAYQDMAGQAAFWVAVDLVAGQELYAQLGTPAIPRLAAYRPRLALVGPGLGSAKVPFDVPAGLGVETVDPTGPPVAFDEVFTGTQDLIWATTTRNVARAGRYYVVAYAPTDVAGRLFVTVGRREQFGLTDLLTYHDTLRGVRAFHEVTAVPLPPLPALLDAISLILRCFNPGFPRPTPGMWPPG